MRCLLLLLLAACSATPAPEGCIDADADTFCADVDCDDTNATVYRLADVYADMDGDQRGVGAAERRCIGAQAPRSFTLQAGDCDDSAAACGTDCTDEDGDMVAACAGDSDDMNADCGIDPTDLDGDRHCSDHDCDETTATRALHWADCGACVDADSDGRGPGCDLGADAATGDPNLWTPGAVCTDADADGYFVGCDAFRTRPGPDCDDAAPTCTNDARCMDGPDTDLIPPCAGDCSDDNVSRCVLAANGAGGASGGSPGGTLTAQAGAELVLLGAGAALPTNAFRGSVPVLGAHPLEVRDTDTVVEMNAAAFSDTWDGIYIARGATLRLIGANPGDIFTAQTSGDVYILGTLEVTAEEANVAFLPVGNASFTVGGNLALAGAAASSGNTLAIGTTGSPFAHIALLGGITLRGLEGQPGEAGGAGGVFSAVTQGDLFTNTAIDVSGGLGDPAGRAGAVTLSAERIFVRGDGMSANGGAAQQTGLLGGSGGIVHLSAATVASTTSFSVTANGAASAIAGAQAGKILITADDALLPWCTANAENGAGGEIRVQAETVTVQAPLQANGTSRGGLVAVAIGAGGSIQWNAPASATGASGQFWLGVGTAATAPAGMQDPVGTSTFTLNASLAASVVDFNVDTLTFGPTGAVTATACHYRTTTTATGATGCTAEDTP